MIKSYYDPMVAQYKASEVKIPRNRSLPNDRHNDKILRELDCAAIEFMHGEILEQVQKDFTYRDFTKYKVFDSTRGVFIEGGPVFEGSGIFEKTHIQICVRNLNCIKGFFRLRKEVDFNSWIDKTNAQTI
ncbi:hypothetical protein ACX0G9_00515 [Flavitalea flava]